ncbi:MAG: hypothetical protein HY290_33525 [Planctomycetia bacterium]|nr:hypothetical protein [Planctomycetia bacterium]
MPIPIFRGDSPPVAQITRVTPANVKVGDTFTLTCNGKSVSYVAKAATVADVVAGLVAAVQTTTIPEFAEMLASPAADNSYFTLVAATAGVPFTVTASTTVTSAGNVTVVETTPGQSAVNEVHQISLIGTYTGGTFTLTWNFGSGNETTGNIAYNASAATVQAAIEALATPVPGDIVVTGGPGPNAPWFVTFKGALGGMAITPGTVNGANLTGNGSVSITTTQDGNGLSNEIQLLNLAGATGGSYSLTFSGQTTASLNVHSTAAQIQTALENLSNIGAGNVAVYGPLPFSPAMNGNFFYVLFKGTLAGTNVDQLILNQGNLTNDGNFPITVVVQSGGQTTADEIQFIDLGAASGGSFTLTYNGVTSPPIHVIGFENGMLGSLFSFAMSNALQILFGNGCQLLSIPEENGAVSVTGFALRFMAGNANTAMQLITINGGGLMGSTGQTVTRLQQGRANQNEIQTVTVFGTAGTFTLSLGSQTTSAIAWNASTGTLQTRIQTDLANTITACTVSGSGTLASPWVVTVTNPANTNIPQMTGNGGSLTGGGGTITEQTHGAAGVNEVQLVTLAAGVSGGTFTLAFQGAVTANTAWNASAATVQTNLRALVTINTVTVSGSNGGPYTVTWSGAQGNSPEPLLVGDGSLLTGATGTQTLVVSTTTFSSGPNHYDDPLNWTGGRVPDTASTPVFESGDDDCLYGLDQIATFTANAGTDMLTFTSRSSLINDQIVHVTNAGGGLPAGLAAATNYYLVNVDRNAGTCQLATTSGGTPIDITSAGTGTHTIGVRLDSFEFSARYTGKIGLPKTNASGGYYEYRARYLHVGLRAAGLQKLLIGTGDGTGSSKIQLDTDVDQVALKVIDTGGSAESGVNALLWKGTHPSNTAQLINGDLGIAIFPGELATLASLIERAGSLVLGAGVTCGPIDKTGGSLIADGATINGVVYSR